MPTWMSAKVQAIKSWHDNLFTLQISFAGFNFKAGQFARLALPESCSANIIAAPEIARAYSLVNPPGADTLEFVIAEVEGGALTPHLHKLKNGAEILVNSHPSGFFTLDHVPDADTIWLLATGTGLGPYLSILQDEAIWQRFSNIRLVHGVRGVADLCYRPWLQQLAEESPSRFHYQPVISREEFASTEAFLQGRIPALISSGELEQASNAVFNESAQVMLCGNPEMIHDARESLLEKGLQKHLKRKPGHVHMEQYWS